MLATAVMPRLQSTRAAVGPERVRSSTRRPSDPSHPTSTGESDIPAYKRYLERRYSNRQPEPVPVLSPRRLASPSCAAATATTTTATAASSSAANTRVPVTAFVSSARRGSDSGRVTGGRTRERNAPAASAERPNGQRSEAAAEKSRRQPLETTAPQPQSGRALTPAASLNPPATGTAAYRTADRLTEKGRSTPPTHQRARQTCAPTATVAAQDSPDPKNPNAPPAQPPRAQRVQRAAPPQPQQPVFKFPATHHAEAVTEKMPEAPPTERQPQIMRERAGGGIPLAPTPRPNCTTAASVSPGSQQRWASTLNAGGLRVERNSPVLRRNSLGSTASDDGGRRSSLASSIGGTLGPSYLEASRGGGGASTRPRGSRTNGAPHGGDGAMAHRDSAARPSTRLVSERSSSLRPSVLLGLAPPRGTYKLLDDDFYDNQRGRLLGGATQRGAADSDDDLLAFQRKLELEHALVKAALRLRMEQQMRL